MSRSSSVPKPMRPIYESVVELTDRVCLDHLDQDYRDLARRMAAALCRKRPSPMGSGQPRVGQSTAGAKAKAISDALHPHRMDPAWMRSDLIDRNPLVWLAQVDGLLVDLRAMPREVQVMAYEQGLIPYVPDDRNAGSALE